MKKARTAKTTFWQLQHFKHDDVLTIMTTFDSCNISSMKLFSQLWHCFDSYNISNIKRRSAMITFWRHQHFKHENVQTAMAKFLLQLQHFKHDNIRTPMTMFWQLQHFKHENLLTITTFQALKRFDIYNISKMKTPWATFQTWKPSDNCNISSTKTFWQQWQCFDNFNISSLRTCWQFLQFKPDNVLTASTVLTGQHSYNFDIGLTTLQFQTNNVLTSMTTVRQL